MAGQLHGIGNNYIIANNAVMCYVGIGHQQAIVTYGGGVFIKRGTAVQRNTFADNGIIANSYRAGLAFVFQVLRRGRNYRARENTTVFTYAGAIHYYRIG